MLNTEAKLLGICTIGVNLKKKKSHLGSSAKYSFTFKIVYFLKKETVISVEIWLVRILPAGSIPIRKWY